MCIWRLVRWCWARFHVNSALPLHSLMLCAPFPDLKWGINWIPFILCLRLDDRKPGDEKLNRWEMQGSSVSAPGITVVFVVNLFLFEISIKSCIAIFFYINQCFKEVVTIPLRSGSLATSISPPYRRACDISVACAGNISSGVVGCINAFKCSMPSQFWTMKSSADKTFPGL